MSADKALSNLLLEVFGGNPYHAKAVDVRGDISYHPVDEPLTVDLIEKHLNGEIVLGTYQLLQGSDSVRWLGWDVDSSKLSDARAIATKIISHLTGLPFAVEFSGRKGYHILLFLKEPMPASEAKRVTEWVRDVEGINSTGETHVECFPKQPKLTEDRPKGNLLKLPLGEHPRTHSRSRFIDIYNGWENGPELNPEEILQFRVHPDEILSLSGEGPSPDILLVNLLSEYWSDGKRHDMALFLSGFLANEGWSQDQAENLIRSLCEATGDVEVRNRVQTVVTTFERYREGKTVRGRQGLAEHLSSSSMNKLIELVSLIRAPDTVLQIDEIRFAKGKASIESARLAANTIWSFMHDGSSRIVQTYDGEAYWYDEETHLVIARSANMWNSLLNKKFGLNPSDKFSRLVMEELDLRIVRDSPYIEVYTRAHWSEANKALYINLGGPEVYIIRGLNEIETSYNGECGLLFRTNQLKNYLIPDFESNEDAWEHLIDDLSFAKTADAPATPEEQRELLKAWVLSFFFPEMMPTKPILSLIGQPGSGKTTAMRRILKILESLDEDVLGVPTDKQDAFRSSIEGHRLLVIDNLEKSGAYWMVDMLNKLATGQHIELRRLYKTNETHKIIPRCFVALTAVSIPFSDETLFSRLLVLEMSKLDDPLPEYLLQRTIRDRGAAIWADLIRKLSSVVEVVKSGVQVKAPTKSRLVDFTVFCEKIKRSNVIDGDCLSRGLLSMTDSQMKQLRESSTAVMLLDEWLGLRPNEASEWRTFAQLYDQLQTMANIRKMNFPWKTAQALFRHFVAIESTLRNEYGADFDVPSDNTGRSPVRVRFKVLLTQ